MANSEISINDKLAEVFRAINTDWRVPAMSWEKTS